MLINQLVPDVATSSSGEATIPLARGDVTGSVGIGVYAKANQVIYTVATGMYLEAKIALTNNSTNVYITINGDSTQFYNNSSYGNREYTMNLYDGDVLAVGSTSYFNLIGLLRKA